MSEKLIDKIPEGYSEGMYNERKYGISKRPFNSNRSLMVFAEELGGKDFVSFNFYMGSNPVLKPCEMPEVKVLDFLEKVEIKKV